ncbi:MAG: exodeoxyribonuclease VII small subunit [Clostridiales bacterium]|mgnify:CR=1 FL=1|nr:exodeoxyribonuclease VII small subunit [Clostridiales bacterium]
MDQETLQKMSFETALARLEEIVGALEGGTAALDDSLALFEEGVALVRLCNGKLDSAQQRIQIVTEENGTMVEKPFDTPAG